MTSDGLNDDFTKRVVVATADMDWQASPSPSVWRKRLDHSGPAEAGRVTSLVRFDANSEFPLHDHPGGEEILVLEGTFSDEHGDYGAGTYLLNAEGFSHAPFSKPGCVLFVKLRQYPGDHRAQVIVDTNTEAWNAGRVEGVEVMPLYGEDGHPEPMRFVRFAPGAQVADDPHPGGEEVFVVDGVVEDEYGRYPKGTWFRSPVGSHHAPFSNEGCLLYVKVGHLTPEALDRERL